MAVTAPARADDTAEGATSQSCTPEATLTDEALRDKLRAAGSHVADPSDATGSTATSWTATIVVPTDLCEATVTFSSYLFPSGFMEPFEDQALFDSLTDTYAPGRYEVAVDLAYPCGWQVDLYVGSLLWPLIPGVGHPGTRQIDVSANHAGVPCEDEEEVVPGTLEVRKETDPAGADALFGFVASFGDPGGFSLRDGEAMGPLSLSGAHEVTEVLTTEQADDGWAVSVTCTGDADFRVDEATAHVTVDPGEVIVCTFLNTRTDGGTEPGSGPPPDQGTRGGSGPPPKQRLPDTAASPGASAMIPALLILALVGSLGAARVLGFGCRPLDRD